MIEIGPLLGISSSPTAGRFALSLVQLLPQTMTEASKAEIFQDSVYQIELCV
jgi:hypothetical protein